MGLFDSIAGQVLGSLTGNNANAEQGGPSALIGLVTSLLTDSSHGGIGGLIKSFEQNGLGNIIASWIGTGQNLPISAEQIQAVLGNEQVQALAQKFGLSTDALSSQLAQFMPQVVDQLTPEGQVPVEGESLGGLLGMLDKLRG